MSLMITDRHSKLDLELWNDYLELDKENLISNRYKRRKEVTISIINNFIKKNKNFFCGISFGKDSIVLCDMFLKIKSDTKIIFIHQIDNMNPYSLKIRDKFLEIHNPINYEEIAYSYKDSDKSWFKKDKPNKWYDILKEINNKYGMHVTGIRYDESGKRRLRFKVHGLETENSFAPLRYMENLDVFTYLYEYDLPVHPNYAMLGDGKFKREYIRVAALGNKEGDGMNRGLWEHMYYNDILNRIRKTSLQRKIFFT